MSYKSWRLTLTGEMQCYLFIDYMLYNYVSLPTGLQLVYTLDEVAFIQNLVFYIQCSYRTPVSKPQSVYIFESRACMTDCCGIELQCCPTEISGGGGWN